MGTVNWAKLFEQGRCKAIGIPWSHEEGVAIYELKIPVEYVRKGILTLEDYEEAKKEGLKDKKSKEELMKEAKEKGINVTPEATTESLEEVIDAAEKPEEEKKPEEVKEEIEEVEDKPAEEVEPEEETKPEEVKPEEEKPKETIKKTTKKKK